MPKTTAATSKGPGSDPSISIGWDGEDGVEISSPCSTMEAGGEAGGGC